jgi:hypothetical protein
LLILRVTPQSNVDTSQHITLKLTFDSDISLTIANGCKVRGFIATVQVYSTTPTFSCTLPTTNSVSITSTTTLLNALEASTSVWTAGS